MSNRDFMIGSIVGGLIGAAAALMLAPKSGKEIREELGQQANKMKEQSGRFSAEQIFEKGSDFVNVAKDKTSTLSQVVSEQSSQIMNKVRDITKNSNGQANDVIENMVGDALEQIAEDSTEPKTKDTNANSQPSENENKQTL
ncbi:YtxH domain-containing protein [Metabacillus niabensis]|uniref:Gas vesicle protein n=1 Tax=Metabacillus niabensis TaxID=324854 RepID=A0ABT9YX84_9BACI|nr:YtxH domain-containing protein [Metabacillus niabensis]MDQ0224567.1 gas vesicle protein [Metabacillus niabensis]